MAGLRAMVVCLAAFALAAFGGEGAGDASDEATKLLNYLAREFNHRFLLAGATPTKRLEELMADDVVIVWSNGERSVGRAKCLQRITKAREDIRGLFKEFAISYEAQMVRFLGDAAIILGKVTLQGTLAEDGTPFRRDVWQTLIFAKSDASWRLVHEHANQTAAPKGAEPQPKEVPQ